MLDGLLRHKCLPSIVVEPSLFSRTICIKSNLGQNELLQEFDNIEYVISKMNFFPVVQVLFLFWDQFKKPLDSPAYNKAGSLAIYSPQYTIRG